MFPYIFRFSLYRSYDTSPISALYRHQILLFVLLLKQFRSLMLNYRVAKWQCIKLCAIFFGTTLYISSDKLHFYSVYLLSGAKCIKFKGSQWWNNLPTSLSTSWSYVSSTRNKTKRLSVSKIRHAVQVWIECTVAYSLTHSQVSFVS